MNQDWRFVGGEEEVTVIAPDHEPVAREKGYPEFDPDQPRDDHGRWGGGGGSEGQSHVAPGAGHHHDVDREGNPWFHVSSVEEAYQLLSEEQRVVLAKPEMVSTLLDKLAVEANKARESGKSIRINLCNVAVEGSNVFCGEHVGIPRIRMPQLGGFPDEGSPAALLPRTAEGGVDIGPLFVQHMIDQHGTVPDVIKVNPAYLKASQSELDGAKVAGLMKAMEAGKVPDAPIYVSREGYIIDGHHRWAARIGMALRSSTDVDAPMPIVKIDADILDALVEGVRFSQLMGLGGRPMGKGHAPVIVGHVPVVKYSPDQPRVPAGSPDGGQWTSGGGGGSSAPSNAAGHSADAGTVQAVAQRTEPAAGHSADAGTVQAVAQRTEPAAEGATPAPIDRPALTKAINSRIESWMKDRITPATPWNRKSLKEFVQFVQAQPETTALINDLMKIDDPDNHPAIEIGHDEFSQIPREQKPVTYLLGWGKNGGTPIHDHAGSEVAVLVERGSITEDVFLTEGKRVSLFENMGERAQAQRLTRELHAPTTITLPSPYIHRMYNVENDYAVSIHSYYPPLTKMGYYTFQAETGDETGRRTGGPLIGTGQWEEDTKPQKGVLKRHQGRICRHC